ncbi:MAG: hypothetical protein ACLPXB_08170 [Thiobacillaceae bacterium]
MKTWQQDDNGVPLAPEVEMPVFWPLSLEASALLKEVPSLVKAKKRRCWLRGHLGETCQSGQRT